MMIDTAVVLAAGLGSRLHPLTYNKPKCLVEVHNKTLLSHCLEAIIQAGFQKVIIVTGYKNDLLEEAANPYSGEIELQFVHNPDFATTNNSYSLGLVRNHLPNGFALIESDLIFDPYSLSAFRQGNAIALSAYDPMIHNGTTASIYEGKLEKLHLGKAHGEMEDRFKTVNICSMDSESSKVFFSALDKMVKAGGHNKFYEEAIAQLIEKKQLEMEVIDFTSIVWDEIDTLSDWQRVQSDARYTEKLNTFSLVLS